MEHGDFLEGIRAAIIDKDRAPKWKHQLTNVPQEAISSMLASLEQGELNIGEREEMKIGFIGLGNMGRPMAENLAKAGYDVTGFDTQPVETQGVSVATTVTEAVRGQDVVITMLPNGAILQSVAAEVLPELEARSVFLDCSTVDVASARLVAESAEEHSVLPLDAPVSGGVGAQALER